MHAGVREPRAGKCPTSSMELVPEGTPFVVALLRHMMKSPLHLAPDDRNYDCSDGGSYGDGDAVKGCAIQSVCSYAPFDRPFAIESSHARQHGTAMSSPIEAGEEF
jgi:hypothetical protein